MPPATPRTLSDSWLLAAFALLAAGIGALWYSAISTHEATVLRERGHELQAIAELKIEFIRLWLNERRGDAIVQAGRLLMARTLVPRAGLAGSYGTQDVLEQMEAIRKAYDYKAVALLDLAGNHRIGAGRLSEFGRGAMAAAARAAIADGKVLIARTYHPEPGERQHIDIDVAAPVADGRKPGAPIVGALVLHLDSRAHLDSLMRPWPAPSESGEAFLVEHMGGEIIYLSSLRQADKEALRKQVSEANLPSALAALGSQGVLEGIDYRGVPVLAAVGQVQDMPWYVVAKVDRAEILAPVRREALWSGALSVLLALALGLAMLAWRQRSRSELALAQEAAESEALRASEARFRYLFELSPDAVFVHRDDHILIANEAAALLFRSGSAQALVGRDWHELVAPEEQPKIESRIARLSSGESSVLPPTEFSYRAIDGIAMQVEATAAWITLGGAPAIMSVVRDISERRAAETQRLQQCREQRDTLVREVHHRIKNHLQGLNGLLNQHKRKEPALGEALDAVIAQIAAISVIHGLQGREADGQVRLVMLLKEIAAFLGARAHLVFPNADDPLCRSCAWRIVDAEGVPVALIVNELITNAVKHCGRPADAPGEAIRIACACDAERISVTFRNPGALPAGFDFAAGSGLGTGLTLVRSLLPHEGAALSFAAADGLVETRLTLTAPVVSRKPQDQVASRR